MILVQNTSYLYWCWKKLFLNDKIRHIISRFQHFQVDSELLGYLCFNVCFQLLFQPFVNWHQPFLLNLGYFKRSAESWNLKGIIPFKALGTQSNRCPCFSFWPPAVWETGDDDDVNEKLPWTFLRTWKTPVSH